MTSRHAPSRHVALQRVCLGLGIYTLSACGDSGGPVPAFEVVAISIQNGEVWPVNRPFRVEFSSDVDFATINGNTLSVVQAPASAQVVPGVPGGLPAQGSFALIDSRTVEFQPTCPQADDFSDAGLQPGQIVYDIEVRGTDSGVAVASTAGVPLAETESRTFTTAGTSAPFAPGEIFEDTVPGGPLPAKDGLGQDRTYLELGGDPLDRITFTDANQGPDGVLIGEQEISLFSDPATGIALVLELNQSVDATSSNISADRVRFESRPITAPPTLLWTAVPTSVQLVANCSSTGSTLRLVPSGILPQRSEVRVVIAPEFSDIVGEQNPLPLAEDFVFRTREYDFTALAPAADMADGLRESFTASGAASGSLEDTSPAFDVPAAKWGNGRLEASFDFSGTGGPGGDFDYLVPSGVTIALDTNLAVVTGGPGFVPTTSQTVVSGVLEVRNLRIEPGGRLFAVGSNPLIIQATGWVEVGGEIVVDGIPAANVSTLNTGNLPELGGPGVAGGGRGGGSSWMTTDSTPKGGDGFGAFDTAGLGGRGGESGYGIGNKNFRRPGGGGGGRLGPPFTSGFAFGTAAEAGADGSPQATGACTGASPPQGGAPGASPFVDTEADNDFWGKQLDLVNDGQIAGELPVAWAGAGGGGGGDAVPSAVFPHPAWSAATDEKGGPGGGGGGQLQILALGDISIEGVGQLRANGGGGATGENTIGTDHMGGGGGGGSGGFIVLQTPKQIRFDNHVALYTPANPDDNNLRAIVAIGGRGAKGAAGYGSTNAGGDGGPGLVQLHVGSVSNIVFDSGVITAASKVSEPPPILLVPDFGPVSRARSKWIPLAGATHDPGPVGGPAATMPVSFAFGGTDADDLSATAGQVDVVGSSVTNLVPLLTSAAGPILSAGGNTLAVDASALADTANDIYLRNPALLRDFRVELDGATQVTQVVSATTAAGDVTHLILTLEDPLPPGVGDYALVPRYFRAVTGIVFDALPANSYVRIEFQGAPADASGNPDTSALAPWTSDIQKLNAPAGPLLEFYRFRVEFNIDVDGTSLGVDTLRPALDFLRTPFRF